MSTHTSPWRKCCEVRAPALAVRQPACGQRVLVARPVDHEGDTVSIRVAYINPQVSGGLRKSVGKVLSKEHVREWMRWRQFAA